MSDSDRYKYFRIEARELVESLSQGVLMLEKGGAGKDLIGRLLRNAHTLKGAARIVKQDGVAAMSHRLEDLLAAHREGKGALSREQINELLNLVDGLASAVASIAPVGDEQAKAAQAAGALGAAEELSETVRVEIRQMDDFLHDVSQAAVYQTAVRARLARFEKLLRMADAAAENRAALHKVEARPPVSKELRTELRRFRQDLVAATEKVERELSRIQERAAELRLLPASSVFGALERAVRDAAQALGRQVTFQPSGGEHRLDAHVLRAMRDALVHIVRNCVAHGIEPPPERIGAGKPAGGTIRLSVKRHANRIVFVCEDDGRGIDLGQVRRAAVASGLSPSEASALDSKAAIELLLRGGVTTTTTVTQVAGRGLGLDVVRETIDRLKGEVRIDTEPSQGRSISLSVPVSLEALSVLEVEVSGDIVCVPFDSIVSGLRVSNRDISRSAEGSSLWFESRAIPFAPLSGLLRAGSGRLQPKSWSALVVRAGSTLAAVGVDRLLRQTSVVIRPLPALCGPTYLISGASFDSEGNPRLVVDPEALVRLIGRGVEAFSEPAEAQQLPILVVDDSLTTRMLEQSILERAGYAVDLAVSGEEALRKARQRRYAMFVVDVEMPGLDGFELIERLQADVEFRNIPAILVTSRASSEDRRRGEHVGARAYIVKSEFEEEQLLGTIRGLIG